MNLLLTGCFNYSSSQLQELEKLGFNIYFIQNEKDPIPIDSQMIDATVCNGLFLHHSIDDFSRLKFIQLTSAGLDRIPIETIRQRNIILKNARGVYSIPMAEWTLTKVLDIYKHTAFFSHNQSNFIWEKNRDLREINGSKVAIVGMGSVGGEVAKRFKAFGASTSGFDLFPRQLDIIDESIHILELSSRINEFDIVVVSVPLTVESEGMFDFNLLSKMKQNSIIINISRGSVFVEKDLISFLKERTDVVAALDVFESEPLSLDSELWQLPNAVLSPHNSFVSDGNKDRMFSVIYENIKEFAES